MSDVGAESDNQGSSSSSSGSSDKKKGGGKRGAISDAFGQLTKESADRSYAAADDAVSRSAGTAGYIDGARVDVKPIELPQSYRRGGKVRRTGKARLHKGERIAARRGGR